MYMNGRGIMERTERLNAEMNQMVDAMWDSLGRAFVGLSAALIGPVLSWAFLVHRFPWDDPAPWWHLWLAATISIIAVIGGIWLSLPWFRAEQAVKRQIKIVKDHAAAMDRETALRGKGWAMN